MSATRVCLCNAYIHPDGDLQSCVAPETDYCAPLRASRGWKKVDKIALLMTKAEVIDQACDRDHWFFVASQPNDKKLQGSM